MSMANYPYPTNFLSNMPGWPANTSCDFLANVTTSSSDQALFSAVKLAA